MRVFAAIKIVPNSTLINVYDEIKSTFKEEKIKWVEENNLHITIKFFGEIENTEVECLKQALLKCKAEKTFGFAIEGVGVFKSGRHPKVMYFGLKNLYSLLEFQQRVESFCVTCGFKPRRRTFTPHLTLGRIKFIKQISPFYAFVEKYKTIPIQQVVVNELILYQSILKPTGAVYKPLFSVQLNKN